MTTLLSWKRTRDEVGVPPVLFVYFTVKVKVVVGVPLVGEALPSVRDTVPHVAESPSTGPANRSRDALNRTVDATAPTKTDRCVVGTGSSSISPLCEFEHGQIDEHCQ